MLQLSLLGPSTVFEPGYYSVALTVLEPSCLTLPGTRRLHPLTCVLLLLLVRPPWDALPSWGLSKGG